MKEKQTEFSLHPSTGLPFFSLQEFTIATRLSVSPEFIRDPVAFAEIHEIDMIGEPSLESKHSVSKNDETGISERKIVEQRNVHLLEIDSIRLLIESKGNEHLLLNITIRPSRLLRGIDSDPLQAQDINQSLEFVRHELTPLLVDPKDQVYLSPGTVRENHRTYWSGVEMEAFFPDYDIRCLHNLSHPLTGDAVGVSAKRIPLRSPNIGATITLRQIKWKVSQGSGADRSGGVRARITLKGKQLVPAFQSFGTVAKIGHTNRLVRFPSSAVVDVHQAMMSQMKGQYLPVPDDWKNPPKKKHLTPAKTLALASVLTGVSASDELLPLDAKVRPMSRTTNWRLKNAVPCELHKLHPIEVHQLFPRSAYPEIADDTNP